MVKEYISFEPENRDAWVCICGNMPHSDGFVCCDEQGNELEPVKDSGWKGLYLCLKCGRIINQETLEVIGVKSDQ